MSTPILELLKYMELEENEETNDRLDKFSLIYHANPMTDTEHREKYIKAITPIYRDPVKDKPQTNITQLQELKKMQEEKRGIFSVVKGGK